MTGLLALILLANPEPMQDNARRYEIGVVSCYDGDTCTVDFQFSAHMGLGMMAGVVLTGQKARLCDIDAPEMRGRELTDEDRSRARLVRDRLIQWMKGAKRLWVEIPQKKSCDPTVFTNCDRKDKYGRWLVWVYADDRLLNERLVDEGLANESHLKCSE
jgi:endonuclease YncB( thermonuclease family)